MDFYDSLNAHYQAFEDVGKGLIVKGMPIACQGPIESVLSRQVVVKSMVFLCSGVYWG